MGFQPQRLGSKGWCPRIGLGQRGTAVQRLWCVTVFYVLAARTWTSHTDDDPTSHD